MPELVDRPSLYRQGPDGEVSMRDIDQSVMVRRNGEILGLVEGGHEAVAVVGELMFSVVDHGGDVNVVLDDPVV